MNDDQRFKSLVGKWMIRCLFLGLAAIMLSSLGLAQQGKNWRIYGSVFTGKISGTEFPNAFMVTNNQMYLLYDDSQNWGMVKNSSKGSLGFSLGFSYDFKALFEQSNSPFGLMAYAEISMIPKAIYSDLTEHEHQSFWDPVARNYVDRNVQYAQTGRRASAKGLTLGCVFFPYKKIPVALDAGFGLWSYHLEYVSGTMKSYGSTVDMSLMSGEYILHADYLGDGKLEKNHFGLMIGGGLKFFFLKYFSLDLVFRSFLVSTRYEGTGYVYVSTDEAVKKSIFGSGDFFGFGLSVYY